MKWTSAQTSAIETHGKTLLVSAAAGSGKTATLTERIIRSLRDPELGGDISRMLVVTYTRAAAAELKVKIARALSTALSENPADHRLASQLMMLESAKICTIDSFYYEIVKTNAARLGLPGSIRIVDSAEMTLLCKNEMEAVIDDFYRDESRFIDFMDHFIAVRGQDACADIFLSVYHSLLAYKGGVDRLLGYEQMLREAASRDFFATPYGETARKGSKAALEYAVRILSRACEFFENSGNDKLMANYYPAFQNDLNTARAALDAVEAADYERARQTLEHYEKLSLKAVRGELDPYIEYLKELRGSLTKLFSKLGEDYFTLTADEIATLMPATADVIAMLYRMLSEFHTRMTKEKVTRGICDFDDIRRYVRELLIGEDGNPTDIAESYRERFDEIYIDEYQDVDELQDEIFRAISKKGGRFMVGDIKQSIYGFRGADSGVFASYKNRFPLLGEDKDAEGCSIFMSDNFRCDRNIVNFSNIVSSYLFRNCGESIGYRPEDDLVFGKALPSEDYVSPLVKLVLISADDAPEEEGNDEKVYYEAEYIAAEIQRLLDGERKADGTPIEPRDIAVLMRQTTDLEALAEILNREGIPTASADKSDFFENPDILLMLSFLSTIDNPRRDIPLAGTLRSPLFGFSFDELVSIRRQGEERLSLYDALVETAASSTNPLGQKCADFVRILTELRNRAAALPVDKLISMLYHEFSIRALCEDSEHLNRLYEYARGFEANSFHGLYSFISYINEIIEKNAKLDKKEAATAQNAVQLITIHHSKGLEYPVCFLYGMGKPFNERFKGEKLQFDRDLGLGMLLHDSTGFASIDTPLRRAIIERKLRAGREEEMRVLYVAMTRARERLYLTACPKNLEKTEMHVRGYLEFGREYGIRSSNSYLDWILAALSDTPQNDCFEILRVTGQKRLCNVTEATAREEAPSEPSRELMTLFETRFAFEYPYRHITRLPAKLSVSRLYPAVLDEAEEQGISAESLRSAFVYPESLIGSDKASGAERGTATHTFLQFCDFENTPRHGVREELSRLLHEHFIDKRTASLCHVGQLEAFFESELFSRMQRAEKIYREQRFNIFLPASEFTVLPEKAELLENEMLAVQGVIDLFFVEKNGDIVLVDYKTDYLSPKELEEPTLAAQKLIERHGEQLSYYAKAIEQMCGKKPRETLIYSLPLGKTIRL